MRGLRVFGALAGMALVGVGVWVAPAGAAGGTPCVVCVSVPATIYAPDGNGDDVRYIEVDIAVRTSAVLTRRIDITYETQDGTARAPGDFAAVSSGTVSILPGATVGYARVRVNRHSLCQSGKHFDVVLSSPSAGRLGNRTARVELRAPSCPS